MSDEHKNYRRAFALNAVAATASLQNRAVYSTLDAQAMWAVAALLDQHAAIPDGVHAEHTPKGFDSADMDPGYVNPAVKAVSETLDKAA